MADHARAHRGLRPIEPGASLDSGVAPSLDFDAATETRPGERGPPLEPLIPDRYAIRESEDGRFLGCDEAPRLRVSIDRGHSFSEDEARDLGGRVILLDGVGRFGPLVDNGAKLFNLDHHEGCERTFTLATCEQALLLVYSGLELSEGDWTIYANEPDLDTVLAIWCLLNYVRLLRLSPESREVLFPLIRLEGAIDANGMELAELCGLPERTLRESKQRLDRLYAIERSTRDAGEWLETDPAQYTREMLQEIDALIFTSADFIEYARVEEIYGHVEIGERRVAVACRDRAGIYAVERNLRKRWGDQLGIIALEKDAGHYTLRRSAPLADIDLHDAYDKLNLFDPAVDGRPPGKRWGGSDNIGGSPRPTGTALAPRDLLNVFKLAYQKSTAWRGLRDAALVALISSGLLLGGHLAGLLWTLFPDVQPGAMSDGTARLAAFSLVAGLGSCILARSLSGRRLWLFGWRRPVGRDWMALVPLVLIGAIPARGWVPEDLVLEPAAAAVTLGGIALTAVALEVWFRGLVHGVLMLDSGAQSVDGRWFVSRAALGSGLFYALVTVAASLPWILTSGSAVLDTGARLALVATGAALAGLALAMMRERSLSIWPGVSVQFLGLVGSAAFWLFVGSI